jgi:hypothetical protein
VKQQFAIGVAAALCCASLCVACGEDTSRLGGALLPKDAGADASPYAFLTGPPTSSDELGGIWSNLPYARIGLTRGACSAGCPEYALVFIRGGGTDSRAVARYEGQSNVDRLGVFEGSVDIREYAQLCQLFDSLGFVSLAPEYQPSWTSNEALATVTVSAVRGPNYYEVADTGEQGPLSLIGLELALDGRAEGVAWGAVPDEVQPDAGRAESETPDGSTLSGL